MAQAGTAVVCASCGSRNKPKWEFCARCGESLKDAVAAEAAPAARPSAPASPDPEGASTGGSVALAALAFAALVGVVVVGWRYARREGPAPVRETQAFAIPVKEKPPPPPPPPMAGAPGASAFAEGTRLLRAGDAEGAAAALATAVSEDPQNAVYVRTLGEALFKAGRRPEGLAALGQAAQLSPAFRLDYAKFLDQAGQGKEAISEFAAILEAEPGSVEAQLGLGLLYSRAKDYAKAIPLLQEATSNRPGDRAVVQALAVALDAKGDAAGATVAYHAILSTHPEAHEVRARLAEMLTRQGRLDEAEAVVRKGLGLSAGNPQLERQLGAVLETAGRNQEAAEAYRRYAELDPAASDAQALVARAARLANAVPR